MPELTQLHAGHAPAVLAFELANRATSLPRSPTAATSSSTSSPSGTAPCWLSKRPASRLYVLVAEDGSVLGRLTCTAPRTALRNSATGSRSTSPAAAWRPRPSGTCAGWRRRGTGCAHSGGHRPRECRVPEVLTKAGFVPVGPADPADLGGKPGTWYQRDLAAGYPGHRCPAHLQLPKVTPSRRCRHSRCVRGPALSCPGTAADRADDLPRPDLPSPFRRNDARTVRRRVA